MMISRTGKLSDEIVVSTDLPKCLICGSLSVSLWAIAEDIEYATTADQFSYYHCAHCGVLSIHPVPLDRLSQIYPPHYYSYAQQPRSVVNWVHDWMKAQLDRRFFTKFLKAINETAIKVLDVGGGSGETLDLIRTIQPAQITLTQIVDISPVAQRRAEGKGHKYFCGRIEEFKTEERFHFALLLNLIEHVEHPLKVLASLAKIMAPGGILLLRTPNFDSLDARLFRHKSWAGYHCPRHWVLFTQTSLTKLVSQTPFRIIKTWYTHGGSFWALSILGILARQHLVTITPSAPAITHPLFPLLGMFFGAFDFLRLTMPMTKTSEMFFLLQRPEGSTA